MAVVEQVMSESVETHVKWVCEQLNEKNRRGVAGLRSEVVGDGGTQWVAEITGVDPNTIRQGRLDLQTGLADGPRERVRRASGCAARAVGDPDGKKDGRAHLTRRRWRPLAKRVGRGCATTVGRLLKPLGSSLKTNVKRLIGKVHPQRDRQYRCIQRL